MDYDPASSTLYMYLTGTHTQPSEFTLRERKMFYAVNDLARSAGTLSELMDAVYNATCDVCPTDRMSFLMLEEGGTRVVSHWVRTRYETTHLTGGYQEDLQGSSLAVLLESGQPRVINDLEQYLEEHPASRATKLLVQEGVRSSLAYPLQVDNQAVGILVRNSTEPWSYGYHQLKVHEVLVRMLSQAVRRAYQYEQVDAANRAYMEVLGFVSHELKSPLASIVMDARLMTEGYVGNLEPKQIERVQKIVVKADYLLSLIREYLDLARLEGGELTLHPRQEVDFVDEVLEQAIDLAHGHIEQREMKIVRMLPRERIKIECDPDLLRIALFNLIGNAAKYGKLGGNIRVGLVVQPDSFEVSVFNDGPGFPPDERLKLFRKFSRLQTAELRKQKGTGVGLYTVWRIVQLHGGRTWAESQQGQWAEFGFAIPQPVVSPQAN